MAAAVASRLTDTDLRDLRQFNRMMTTAADEADLQAFGQWNRRFHEVFLLRLDNRALRDTCNLVRGPLYTFPSGGTPSPAGSVSRSPSTAPIIRLAGAGDAEALGAYFRNVHWSYERNQQFITDAFDRQGEAAIHL